MYIVSCYAYYPTQVKLLISEHFSYLYYNNNVLNNQQVVHFYHNGLFDYPTKEVIIKKENG
jgi:hypothetical protein